MTRRYARRSVLAGAGAMAAGLVVGCGGERRTTPGFGLVGEDEGEAASATPSPQPSPTPTPTPRPAGLETRALMAGTEWETAVSIRSSGVPGPALVVLGGVHGNEPGGWLAADEIAAWEPVAGVLAVVPRANRKAIAGFLRLVEGEGDLNRSYPGDAASEVAMSRLAAGITALAAELGAEVLLDLHESWAFFADREAAGFQDRAISGTAFLGQTITGGVGPRTSIATELGAAVNPALSQREQFFVRDGRSFRRDDSSAPTSNRGRSSLSLGGHVPGLTPVLVETAQQDLAVERRREMHLAVVRAALDILRM